MGEAKRRAERRREAREAEAPKPTENALVELKTIVPRRFATQLRARHHLVKKQFPSFEMFLAALIGEAVEVFDHDIAAFEAHARGESRHVAPPAPEPERLVVPAGEVDPAAVKTLAKMHDATVAAARG